MAGSQELVQLFDVPSTEKDKERIIGMLDEVDAKIKSISSLSIASKNIGGVSDFRKTADDMAKGIEDIAAAETKLTAARTLSARATAGQIKQYEDIFTTMRSYQDKLAKLTAEQARQQEEFKKGVISITEYRQKMASLGMKAAQAKQELSELSTTVKTQAKQNQAAAGSMDAMNARLGLLRNSYRALSATAREGSFGKSIQVEITTLDSALKQADAAIGNHQRKVGDYENAIVKAASRVWSGIRKLAYIIPGLGIGGLVALLIEPFTALFKQLVIVQDKIGSVNDLYKKHAELLGEAGDEYKKAVANVAELTDHVALAKQGFLDKKKVVDEYNNSMGKTAGFVKDLDGVEQQLVSHAEAYIKFTLLKAVATAALGKSAQEALKFEEESRKKTSDYSNFLDKISVNPGAGTADADFELAVKERQAKRKGLAMKTADDNKRLEEQIARDYNAAAAKLAKENGFDFFGDKPDKPKAPKQHKDMEDYAAAFKKLMEEIVAFNKKAFDVDATPLKKEMDAAAAQYEHFFNATRDLRNKDLADVDKSQKKKEITEKEAAAQRLIINDAANADLLAAESAYWTTVNAIGNKFSREAAEKRKKDDEKNLADGIKHAQDLTNEAAASAKQTFADNVAKAQLANDKKQTLDNARALNKAVMEQEVSDAQASFNYKVISAIQLETKIFEIKKAYLEKNRKAEMDNALAIEQAIIGYVEQAKDLAGGLLDLTVKKRLNSLQKEIDGNNKLKEAESARINNSTLSEEQKAAALVRIQLDTQNRNEAIQRKMRDERRKEAAFEKAAALVRIIENTAIAVTHQIGTGDPYTAAGRALLVGAIGAAQFAITAAQPLPQYWQGTDHSKGGWALTDERGPEFYETPSGKKFMGNDQPTLRYLEPGTKITPADEVNRMLMGDIFRWNSSKEEQKQDLSELKEVIQNTGAATVAALKKKQVNHNHFKIDMRFDQYLDSWRR